MSFKKHIILFTVLLTAISINAQTISIEITNIRSKKGKIVVAVFKNNEDFKKEITFSDKSYSKCNVKNGNLTIKQKLKPGIYGISILDDKNNDGKMEYNFIGLPKEGYGFSNFFHRGMNRPEFEDFDFIVGKENKTVYVKMKYF